MRYPLLAVLGVLLLTPVFASAATSCTYLSPGNSGPAIIALQRFLVTQSNNFPTPTGYFGTLTQAAVRQWQSDHGIVSYGSPATTGWGAVGPRTAAAMHLCNSNLSTTPNASVADLIQSLLLQVQALKARIAALQAQATSTPGAPYSSVPPASPPIPPVPPASCVWGNGHVANGASVTAYQAASVAYGSQCVSEQRLCANGTLSGSHQYASCTQRPGPLLVGPSSRVVVMEYEAWFNPLFNPQLFTSAAYRPQLTSATVSAGYDSIDPKVLDQHYQWLHQLGVDAIIGEQSNGGPCDYGDAPLCTQFLASLGTPNPADAVAPYTAQIHAINQGTFNLYPAFSQRGAAIKIIPMADGQDVLMFSPRGDGTTPFDAQVGAYYEYVTRYPELSVIYEGKPLFLVYMGAAQSPADPNSAYQKAHAAAQKWQDRFTIRLMAGFIDSQPNLWGKAFGISGLRETASDLQLWSWIDRYNPYYNLFPSYSMEGGRVEAFTVTSAAGSTYAENPWGAPDATLYKSGVTLSTLFELARQLNPIFLIYNQFNEFGGPPDEGADIEHSNDIEPTQQWGSSKFNVAMQKIQEYKLGPIAAPVVDAKSAFITSLYRCILLREPESAGLAGWLSSATSIPSLVRTAFGSTEYASKATTNDIYARQLFQCVLGRAGNSQEVANMTNLLASGTSRSVLLDSFLSSSEFLSTYGKLIQNETGLSL